MDTADRTFFDDFFPAGMSVHVDSGYRSARNQFLALATIHGRLHAGAGLCCLAGHLPGRASIGIQLELFMFDWQLIIVGLVLVLACSYIGWRGWLRLSSLSVSKRMNAPSCGEGCGACGEKSAS